MCSSIVFSIYIFCVVLPLYTNLIVLILKFDCANGLPYTQSKFTRKIFIDINKIKPKKLTFSRLFHKMEGLDTRLNSTIDLYYSMLYSTSMHRFEALFEFCYIHFKKILIRFHKILFNMLGLTASSYSRFFSSPRLILNTLLWLTPFMIQVGSFNDTK